MKGKFGVYLLQPFGIKLIFSIVAQSTVHDSLVVPIQNGLDPPKMNWTLPKQLVLDQNDLDSPKSF